MHAMQIQGAGSANSLGAPPAQQSEVESELTYLNNALSSLDSAQRHLAGRLESVSRQPSPEKMPGAVHEALSCSLSSAIQSARITVDQITARINASIELLAI